MNKQALRPDFITKHLPSLNKEETEGPTVTEKRLYTLSKSAGWKELKAFIEDLTKDLDKFTLSAIQEKVSMEEVGKYAMVVSLAKDIIDNIVNKVEDARESIENEQR